MYKNLSEIVGFENCNNYIIYDDGKLYSKTTKRFLKPLKDSKGYYYYDLRGKCAKYSCPKVHRLVMLAFTDYQESMQINHKDGDKSNNSIDNLEWCTNEQNRKHALQMQLKSEIDFGIAQYDLQNNLLYIWHTAADAMSWLGLPRRKSGEIGRAIRKGTTFRGYKWKQYSNYDYLHPEKYQNQILPQRKKTEILMIDNNNNIIKIFDSQRDAAEYLGMPRTQGSQISLVISGKRKTYKGFKWGKREITIQ